MTETKQPPATTNRWWDYVEDLCAANGINTAQFVRSVGVTPSAASTWKNKGGGANPELARKVAYQYQRPVIEVFINAGLLSRDDLEGEAQASPDQLADDVLIHEISRRMTRYSAENKELHSRLNGAGEDVPEEEPSKATGKRRTSKVATVMRRPDTRD